MTPDFTLIWPLSCLKDGVHLCRLSSKVAGDVESPDARTRHLFQLVPLGREDLQYSCRGRQFETPNTRYGSNAISQETLRLMVLGGVS